MLAGDRASKHGETLFDGAAFVSTYLVYLVYLVSTRR
jgi:hypothetical protein